MVNEKREIGYNEVNIGDVFISASRTVSEADIMTFAGMTGDNNEIHTSEAYAKTTAFGTRIAHGLLTLGIANGLYVRMGLFENSVMLEIKEWKIPKPVKLGDTIRLRLTIEDKRPTKKPDKGICNMRYEVLNQNDEVVAGGLLIRMVPIR